MVHKQLPARTEDVDRETKRLRDQVDALIQRLQANVDRKDRDGALHQRNDNRGAPA